MCVPIQRIHRDSTGLLTHIGGSTSDGVPWGLTAPQRTFVGDSAGLDVPFQIT